MKKTVMRIFGSAVLLMIVLGLATCFLFQNKFEFVNNSSYTVSVYPIEQESWEFFELDPGDTHTITINEDYINFIYGPAYYVKCDQSQAGRIVFTNR